MPLINVKPKFSDIVLRREAFEMYRPEIEKLYEQGPIKFENLKLKTNL